MAGAGSLAGLQHSASLFKTFLVGWVGGGWVGGGWWVGGLVGGWVRNTGNKAQLRPAGAGALPELGNSCHKKSFLVTGNQFLSQEINCSKKNSLSLVKLAHLTCGIVGIQPKI